jgi:mono/diheme cytochrome c family protein
MNRILILVALICVQPAWGADYVAMPGEQLYRRFCASCHGLEGRGDGPVASTLRVEVPDLTRPVRRSLALEQRERIARIIDGRYIIGAHGTRIMPVWGEDLTRLEIGNPDAERSTEIIIGRLADYVAGLQRPNVD